MVAAVGQLQGQLWFIYDALERAVGSVNEHRLRIEADLAAAIGGDWKDKVRILPETAAYVGRLEEISCPEHAVEVLAHQHVLGWVGIDKLGLNEQQSAALINEAERALAFQDGIVRALDRGIA
ncbi:Heme oxygenase [Corynebacterium camporealensis]|uniref:biliverdin-producing heme oxygenase n=1 Tax=Corynebacterium camporealensis TaxID=161896 RepID=UPI000CFA472E|nr:biliverdin-producing heme oxygenase [Corynebacterium camporealensis]AVH87393.1 Heme oxygenase [Corynebacterium camporealensis]